jgi:type 1 glutamine amidotransferase
MSKEKSALILWGGWEGHEPGRCSETVQGMLVEDGFKVTRETNLEILVELDPGSFDLIVPIYSMGSITDAQSKALTTAVEAGAGLAGFHGGMGDSFRNSTSYQFMTGGQFVAHPGNIITYRVNIVDHSDPITAGLDDFDYRSEQYYMHVDPNNHVLATTTFSGEHAFWIAGAKMPVVWKRRHGRGKVFFSSLGHVASEFEVKEMRTIWQRGMKWAVRE